MKPASPGVRFALWINENEGTDLNHQGRVRVAKKINAMVKAEVQKSRRSILRFLEEKAKDYDAMQGDWSLPSQTVRDLRRQIINRSKP